MISKGMKKLIAELKENGEVEAELRRVGVVAGLLVEIGILSGYGMADKNIAEYLGLHLKTVMRYHDVLRHMEESMFERIKVYLFRRTRLREGVR